MPTRNDDLIHDLPEPELSMWVVTLRAVTADGGQGSGEGPLELRVTVAIDGQDGTTSFKRTIGPRGGTVSRVPFTNALLTGIPAFPDAQGRTFNVAVTVVDVDAPAGGIGNSELAPNDSATATAEWTLSNGSSSTLPLVLRLADLGSPRRREARVEVTLSAVWRQG